MKLKRLVLTVICLASLAANAAFAQGIAVSPQPYQDNAALPIAPIVVPPAPGMKPAVAPQYVLHTGEPIDKAIVGWAEREGWLLQWYPAVSWKTLRETRFERTDVAAAVGEVIDVLRAEGKAVQLRISEGNHVMEVLSTEVRND
jgi:toxin co-regulated pilus biosynthesis protein Q